MPVLCSDYLLLLRGGIRMTSKTEAQNKEEMQACGVCMGGLGQAGHWEDYRW